MDQIIINTMTDDRLWIADINSVSRRTFRTYEITYNLNLALKPITDRRRINSENVSYRHIPFRDGKTSQQVQSQFNQAVTTVLQRLRKSDDRIVVNCGAGVSRSAAVAATVVGVCEDLTFQQALANVAKCSPTVNPYGSLQEYGSAYLNRSDYRK